jgi:hypothetical protein
LPHQKRKKERLGRKGNLSLKNNCRDIPLGGWLHMQTTKGLAISLLVFLLLAMA